MTSFLKIRDIAIVKYGKSNPKTKGSIPLVGSSGIYGYVADNLTSDTIIIGRKGTAGKAWYIEGPVYPSDTTFYLDNINNVDLKFLYYYFIYSPLDGQHAKTTIPSLQKQDLEDYLIPDVPLPEQQKIAHVLSTILEAKEKTEAVIAAAKELKRSLMKYLFTYGPVPVQDAPNVRLKETEIGMIPEKWEIKKFRELSELQRGKDLTKKNMKKGNYPVVGSGGIIAYHNEHIVEGPGVVVGRSGSIGNTTYIESDYWPHNTCLFVKQFHGNVPKYVYYVFSTFNFKKYATGVSVPTLNRNYVHDELVAIPNINVQQSIVQIIDEIGNKIESDINKKMALESLFNSMLEQLMTGTLRVDDLDMEGLA